MRELRRLPIQVAGSWWVFSSEGCTGLGPLSRCITHISVTENRISLCCLSKKCLLFCCVSLEVFNGLQNCWEGWRSRLGWPFKNKSQIQSVELTAKEIRALLWKGNHQLLQSRSHSLQEAPTASTSSRTSPLSALIHTSKMDALKLETLVLIQES